MINFEVMSRSELIALLRRIEEEQLHIPSKGGNGRPTRPTPPDKLQGLFEGLRLHQFRLERQNSDLRESQLELENARNHLGDLYDFAPISYVTLDEKGRIQQINKTGATLLGMEALTLIGKPFIRFVKPEDVRIFLNHLERCANSDDSVSSELGLNLSRANTLHAQIASVRVPDHQGRRFVYRTVVTDITERKLTEEQIHKSLREKEVLLKEVHHRVKNNLQVISSLLKLQSGYVQDQRALDLFREMQDIVRSMALIHEKLYRSDDLSSVNYAEYINDIAVHLFRSYGVSTDDIELSVDVADVAWGLDTAIPLSLIINELISNALKYAFPDRRKGQISIRLYTFDGLYFTLLVSDNGIGIPEGIDIHKTDSLGLPLVCALTEELQGNLTLERYKGSRFTITFTVDREEHARQ